MNEKIKLLDREIEIAKNERDDKWLNSKQTMKDFLEFSSATRNITELQKKLTTLWAEAVKKTP